MEVTGHIRSGRFAPQGNGTWYSLDRRLGRKLWKSSLTHTVLTLATSQGALQGPSTLQVP